MHSHRLPLFNPHQIKTQNSNKPSQSPHTSFPSLTSQEGGTILTSNSLHPSCLLLNFSRIRITETFVSGLFCLTPFGRLPHTVTRHCGLFMLTAKQHSSPPVPCASACHGEWALRCFQLQDRIAVNMPKHASLWTLACISEGYLSATHRTAASQGLLVFGCKRCCPVIFQSGCTSADFGQHHL